MNSSKALNVLEVTSFKVLSWQDSPPKDEGFKWVQILATNSSKVLNALEVSPPIDQGY